MIEVVHTKSKEIEKLKAEKLKLEEEIVTLKSFLQEVC
jgi:cell division protein FtsB